LKRTDVSADEAFFFGRPSFYEKKFIFLPSINTPIMANSNFIQEFKAFIMKGNVVDMAVGVIIGAAFGKIVTSLVEDIIMPPIGYLINGVNFSELKWTLPVNPLSPNAAPATICYGNFIQTLLNFLIVAFCIFLVVKAVMKLSHKKEEEPAAPAPPAPTKEEQLLTEIRDIMKKGGEK
jgi:large conductance mechanosensitive channel